MTGLPQSINRLGEEILASRVALKELFRRKSHIQKKCHENVKLVTEKREVKPKPIMFQVMSQKTFCDVFVMAKCLISLVLSRAQIESTASAKHEIWTRI